MRIGLCHLVDDLGHGACHLLVLFLPDDHLGHPQSLQERAQVSEGPLLLLKQTDWCRIRSAAGRESKEEKEVELADENDHLVNDFCQHLGRVVINLAG